MKYSFIRLLFILLLFDSKVILNAQENYDPSGINIGLYEKGPYLGIFSNLNSKDQLEIGINYINVPIGSYNVGLSEKIKANILFSGIKMSYRKFINYSHNITGPYFEAAIEASRMAAYSKINLSDLSYNIGNVSILCPTCESLELNIQPKAIDIIPSLSIGWQYIISPRLSIKSSIGIQYKKINSADWEYKSNNNLPFFVKGEIDNAISNVNSDLDTFPSILPTLNLSMSYSFN